MMTIFEPLFILCFVSTVVVLIVAATAAIRGKRDRAVASLRKLGICAAIYAAALLAVALASPRKVYRIGDPQCFDDWCITVTGATRLPPHSAEVALRLSSRARRVPQGEKGTVGYLVDSVGRRYDPAPDSVTVPFDTKLQPGESVMAMRRFEVPEDVRDLGFVYTHEGGFPIGWFIIGENEMFHGPPVVLLDFTP
jgi:hypothetical protein